MNRILAVIWIRQGRVSAELLGILTTISHTVYVYMFHNYNVTSMHVTNVARMLLSVKLCL